MNLYILPGEVKADLPDMIKDGVEKYDGVLYRRCQAVSRQIDRRCKREFYPQVATKYFSVGQPRGAESALGILWIPDLISITSISFSYDNGGEYTELAETDYILAVGEDFDKSCSYNTIILDVNGDYSSFPRGQRSVKIVGVWGYTDDRNACWEDSGITITGDITAGATTIIVSDGSAEDIFGSGVALMIGRLIRIDDEYFQIIGITDNAVTVLGGRNGSSQADHSSGGKIYLWRPYYSVVDAARTMIVMDFIDSQQGYSIRGAENIAGQTKYNQYKDQVIVEKLSNVIRMAI